MATSSPLSLATDAISLSGHPQTSPELSAGGAGQYSTCAALLEAFWEARWGPGREEIPWAKVLELLVVSRLVSPGSESRLHRQGFDQSAMGDLLGTGFAVAEKDRLYRCPDRILKHKAALFDHLRQRWQDLFQARFDISCLT